MLIQLAILVIVAMTYIVRDVRSWYLDGMNAFDELKGIGIDQTKMEEYLSYERERAVFLRRYKAKRAVKLVKVSVIICGAIVGYITLFSSLFIYLLE